MFPFLYDLSNTCSSVRTEFRYHYAQHHNIPPQYWNTLDARHFYPRLASTRATVHEWRTHTDVWNAESVTLHKRLTGLGTLDAYIVTTSSTTHTVFPAKVQALLRHERTEPVLERQQRFWPSHVEERQMRLLTMHGAPHCLVVATVSNTMGSPTHGYRSHGVGELVVYPENASPAEVDTCLRQIAMASARLQRVHQKTFGTLVTRGTRD